MGFWAVFGLRSCPDGSGWAVGFICSLFRGKGPSILDPFRAILDDLVPNRHSGPDLDLQDQAGDGPLEWVRPVPKSPERSWHASGPSFRPNRRFANHFGPNLMSLDQTRTLVNRDWTWAEAWADLGLRPTLDDLGLMLGHPPLLCPGYAMSSWFGYSQSHSQLGSSPPWMRTGP